MSFEKNDALDQDDYTPPVLPTMLNVLTILTIIGCVLFLLFSLATPSILKFSKKMMAESEKKEMTPKQMAEIEEARKAIELSETHMIPMMALTIAGIILCFIGALMMRKLKKDGYWIYLAGQIIPIIGTLVIVGTAAFATGGSFFFPVISVIFIILYTTQRKYLVR